MNLVLKKDEQIKCFEKMMAGERIWLEIIQVFLKKKRGVNC